MTSLRALQTSVVTCRRSCAVRPRLTDGSGSTPVAGSVRAISEIVTSPRPSRLSVCRYLSDSSVIGTFNTFNYAILKKLCESPLPDASVLNLVDNAVRIQLEDEPGEPAEFIMTHVGYLDIHHRGGARWTDCGCNCLIEWNGQCKFMSLEVAYMLQTTGRMRTIPFEERMSPRAECVQELEDYPHPNAVTWRGKPITAEMIEADVERVRAKRTKGMEA
jgi:hypothetical protein